MQTEVCPAGSLCQQARPFRVCMGTAGSVFCSVPVPAGLFMDCAGRGWSPVTGPFQHLQSDLVWWAYLKGLPDHSQDGLELNHRPLKDPKPGLRSVRLLPEACVSVTPAGSLGVWCC